MTNSVEGALYIYGGGSYLCLSNDAVCSSCGEFVNKHPSIQILGCVFDFNWNDATYRSV
jgi:hypothetical protein